MQQKSPQELTAQKNTGCGDSLYYKIGLPALLIAAVCIAVLVVHWPGLSAKALSFDDNHYFTDKSLRKRKD